jgi:hypothetical protein
LAGFRVSVDEKSKWNEKGADRLTDANLHRQSQRRRAGRPFLRARKYRTIFPRGSEPVKTAAGAMFGGGWAYISGFGSISGRANSAGAHEQGKTKPSKAKSRSDRRGLVWGSLAVPAGRTGCAGWRAVGQSGRTAGPTAPRLTDRLS